MKPKTHPPRLCGCGQPSLPHTAACASCDLEFSEQYPPVPPVQVHKTRAMGQTTPYIAGDVFVFAGGRSSPVPPKVRALMGRMRPAPSPETK